MDQFPRWYYHKEFGATLVQSEADLETLCDGWEKSPSLCFPSAMLSESFLSGMVDKGRVLPPEAYKKKSKLKVEASKEDESVDQDADLESDDSESVDKPAQVKNPKKPKKPKAPKAEDAE